MKYTNYLQPVNTKITQLYYNNKFLVHNFILGCYWIQIIDYLPFDRYCTQQFLITQLKKNYAEINTYNLKVKGNNYINF